MFRLANLFSIKKKTTTAKWTLFLYLGSCINRIYFVSLFVWVLWHINICRLFNAKSIFIQPIDRTLSGVTTLDLSGPGSDANKGVHRRCSWYNGYRRRKWTLRQEFNSWTSLIAFRMALIPFGKVWIQLFSLQLCVNSRADWVLQPWWGN